MSIEKISKQYQKKMEAIPIDLSQKPAVAGFFVLFR